MTRAEELLAETERIMKLTRDEHILTQCALDKQRQLDNIEAHIDVLLDKDFQAHIGADRRQELHMRVFRIIQELLKMKGDDVDPHEHNYEPCPKCSYMTLPTRSRNCSNCHLQLSVEVPTVPPPLILC
jgi:hypothetical protein